MLILNANDIIRAISPMEIMSAVEAAFLLQESDKYYMPDREHYEHKGNVLLSMPCFKDDYFATKLVSVFPENKKFKKPSIYGTVILNDGKTGEPLAMLDGSKLTALRTGAVGALGVAYTSPNNISSIGLVGAGVQGYHQLMFSGIVRNIQNINVYDPYQADMDNFIIKVKETLPEASISISSSIEKLINSSEVIITATTSLNPIIPYNDKLTKGKHFVGIGSFKPEMQEFDMNFFRCIKNIFVDTDLAKQESGDLRIPLDNNIIHDDQILTLGKLINGTVNIDLHDTTFFKSVGMALFDLMTAQKIYENAVQNRYGQTIDF